MGAAHQGWLQLGTKPGVQKEASKQLPIITMKTTSTRSKRVKFSQIEIIELPYALGDNPSVSCGVPITASWEAQKRTTLNLDFFETYRPVRRNKRQLALSRDARKQL